MDLVTQVVLPLALAFMRFSMGLALVADDFRRVVARPKAFAVGALCQMLLLPLIALALVLGWQASFGLDPVLAVGFLILAACPGGPPSNAFSFIAGGNVALSISMTAVSSLLCVFTVPFIVNFGLGHFGGEAFPERLVPSRAVLQLALMSFEVKVLRIDCGAAHDAGRNETDSRRLRYVAKSAVGLAHHGLLQDRKEV